MLAYFLYLVSPVSEDLTSYRFQISEGEGFREIARHLRQEGIIKSEFGFKIYALLSGRAHRLKPGEYFLSPSRGARQIVKSLAAGPAEDKAVTIIEGETVVDINAKLHNLGILPPAANLAPDREGFLFPDTYRFFPSSSPQEVLGKFAENFSKKAQPFLLTNGYQILIMASLIEKEIPLPEDRFLVSGILWKRFRANMPLQVDATVCYAKLKSSIGCYPLSRQDFSLDSPYNTYKYSGLPPSPIGNPGLDAILAARHPKDSSFWYYLSDPKTKKTIFAQSLEEHNENRARYLGL